METFQKVSLLACVAASILWAAVVTWVIWGRRAISDRSPTTARVAAALFVLLGLAYIVHMLADYPTRGDNDLVAGFGVGLSLLAGIVAGASSPRYRLPLLLGSLGMAFFWYMSRSVLPPVVALPSDVYVVA